MKLDDLPKTSLDELRMQILGIQVLFGFQFQGLFQDGFHDLSFSARRIDAVGFGMMILARPNRRGSQPAQNCRGG